MKVYIQHKEGLFPRVLSELSPQDQYIIEIDDDKIFRLYKNGLRSRLNSLSIPEVLINVNKGDWILVGKDDITWPHSNKQYNAEGLVITDNMGRKFISLRNSDAHCYFYENGHVNRRWSAVVPYNTTLGQLENIFGIKIVSATENGAITINEGK
jgi:hypothetical protein